MREEIIEWIGIIWILQIFVKLEALIKAIGTILPFPPPHKKKKNSWILMKMVCILRNKSAVVS